MRWTKEHTAQVLELYLKERPRAQDKQEQQVREMAAKLERSPASIGMKIANFIFLDPLAEERNRKGMSQVSELDKEVWLELSGVPLSTRATVGDSATDQIMSETIGFDIEHIVFAKAHHLSRGKSDLIQFLSAYIPRCGAQVVIET